MAIALVANVGAISSNGGTSATTSAIDTSGANFLIIALGIYQGLFVSDSKGNTWTGLTLYGPGPLLGNVKFYYAVNPTVGSGHTFQGGNGAASYPSLCVAAFSGVDTSSPFDVQNGNSSDSSNPIHTGSITPNSDNQLVVTAAAPGNSVGTVTVDSGFTITDSEAYTAGQSIGSYLAYKIQTTAAAVNAGWTGGSSGPGTCTIASFKAGAGGGVAAVQYRSLLGVGI